MYEIKVIKFNFDVDFKKGDVVEMHSSGLDFIVVHPPRYRTNIMWRFVRWISFGKLGQPITHHVLKYK